MFPHSLPCAGLLFTYHFHSGVNLSIACGEIGSFSSTCLHKYICPELEFKVYDELGRLVLYSECYNPRIPGVPSFQDLVPHYYLFITSLKGIYTQEECSVSGDMNAHVATQCGLASLVFIVWPASQVSIPMVVKALGMPGV